MALLLLTSPAIRRLDGWRANRLDAGDVNPLGITKRSRAWPNKVAPAKPWPTQCLRNHSRASANGPVRCRATTRGYLNKVSKTVSDLRFERGRSDQYSGFSYVASSFTGSLIQRDLQAGRHIILEAT
jgi:hypothetical protein